MSLEFRCECPTDELAEFLLDEHRAETGIPIHPFSVVNATISAYNGALGIADSANNALFIEGPHTLKSYGTSNPFGIVNVLNACNAGVECLG